MTEHSCVSAVWSRILTSSLTEELRMSMRGIPSLAFYLIKNTWLPILYWWSVFMLENLKITAYSLMISNDFIRHNRNQNLAVGAGNKLRFLCGACKYFTTSILAPLYQPQIRPYSTKYHVMDSLLNYSGGFEPLHKDVVHKWLEMFTLSTLT